MFATLTLIALLQVAAEFPSPRFVELLPAGNKTPLAMTLPRDQRLNLQILVIAPADESVVDELKTSAALSIVAEQLGKDGKRRPIRTRAIQSGSGQSEREHSAHVILDLLDTPEARRERMLRFFGSVQSNEGALAYLDNMYVANPPGEYRIAITYRPKTGAFAGQTLERTLAVVVAEGPDSLDRMGK